MTPELEPVRKVKESPKELAWLLVLFIGFYTVNTLCFAIIGGLIGKVWASLSAADRFLTVVAIVGSWTTTMMAFFSKMYGRWSEGKSLLSTNGNGKKSGDTDLMKKP